MCYIDNAELPRMCDVTYPVARKEHACCECGSVIVRGEKYQKISGLWETFQTFKTCMFCVEVSGKARSDLDLNSDETIPFGYLWDCVGMDYGVKK